MASRPLSLRAFLSLGQCSVKKNLKLVPLPLQNQTYYKLAKLIAPWRSYFIHKHLQPKVSIFSIRMSENMLKSHPPVALPGKTTKGVEDRAHAQLRPGPSVVLPRLTRSSRVQTTYLALFFHLKFFPIETTHINIF